MGCFNMMGFYSNLPIVCGDEIVAFICVKKPYHDMVLYPHDILEPICFPIFGEYDDYGCIEKIKRSATVDLLEKVSGIEIEQLTKDIVEYNGLTYEGLNNYIGRDKEEAAKFFKFFKTIVYDIFKKKIEENIELFEKLNKEHPEDAELMGMPKRLNDWYKNFMDNSSICITFEHKRIYDKIYNVSVSKKESYFWKRRETLDRTWDSLCNYKKYMKEKHNTEINFLYGDSVENLDYLDYSECENAGEDIRKYKEENKIDVWDTPYRVCGDGSHINDYTNILYKYFDDEDVNIFKEEYLNYAMFYNQFIMLRGTFVQSTYGGQTYHYLAAYEVEKERMKILEEVIDSFEDRETIDDIC